jgi:3'(2'), 5'-bisphosphate nucleotidase
LQQLPKAYQLAIQAAIAAAKVIMEIYQQDFSFLDKTDGSPVTQADLASSTIIEQYLSPLGIPITGEESAKAPFELRQSWTQSWCIDPLDGTKEFIKRNDEFVINIALIENGKPIFGLIASPVQEEILLGSKEIGVFILHFKDVAQMESWKQLGVPEKINKPLVMTCSRSHHSGPVLQIINALKAEGHELDYIKKGSALKFFDLATGRADIYPRFAPTMEWDIAAGQAILEALGGEVLHAETGEPLHYNKANLVNPYFVARTKALREHKSSALPSNRFLQ